MRALILVNKRARRAVEGRVAAVEILETKGFKLVSEDVEHPGAIGEAIRRNRDAVDCVIVAGGDGSVNTALESLIETGLPLGVLPLGTANDFARTLGIAADVSEACDVIARGLTHRVDVGRVNGRHFLNAASMGLSVWIAEHMHAEDKRRWGVLAYAFALKDALRASRSFAAQIVCDGRKLTLRTIQLTVGNGVHYGGGLVVAEDAAIDDATLNLLSVAPLSPWRLLSMAWAFRSGRFQHQPMVHVLNGRHIEVRTHRPRKINTDGEVTTETPAVFDILPAAITVFVPPDYLAAREPAAA